MNFLVTGLGSAVFLLLKNNYRATVVEVGGSMGERRRPGETVGVVSTALNRSGRIWRRWMIISGTYFISPLYILYYSAKVSSSFHDRMDTKSNRDDMEYINKAMGRRVLTISLQRIYAIKELLV